MLYNIFLSIHFVLCFALIVVVLLQQGKGAEIGASLTGGSNTVFGAGGATKLVTRFTTIVAILFMLNTILLVKLSQHRDITAGSAVVGSAAQPAVAAPEAPAAQPPPTE